LTNSAGLWGLERACAHTHTHTYTHIRRKNQYEVGMEIAQRRVLLPQHQGTRIFAQPVHHQPTSALQLPQQEQQLRSPETKGDNEIKNNIKSF